ncbi:glycosyltransferase [Rhodococcus sp. IEGM 1381]|uniref:glycosyltransferase n=1 Tax=Rhodococcus sp. IEGM 1381 TaxID=3047085 RepID=UPI0024B66B58|nr:glycosyltransferase [Rhodococcus sp. IEGM 1381]MDI9894229.1 glycosyltransferase [Rhodococcus sp. IEGM 1381]
MTSTSVRPVVIFSSMYFDGHQLYDQRLARALATTNPVLYVEPPTPLVRRPGKGKRTFGFGSTDAAGVTTFTPATLPFGSRRLLYPLSGLLIALQIWIALFGKLRTLRFQSVFVAVNPVTKRLFPARRSVSLIKDDYAAAANLIGIPTEVVQRRFRSTIRRARNVVVVSPVLRSILLRRGVRSRIIPAGCHIPNRQWDEPAELSGVAHPRAVFVGMVSDRIDLNLMQAVVESGVSVVGVGQVQPTFSKQEQFEQLRGHNNFHWLPPRSGADLEAVIQHCAVGLIPYELSEFNRSSFPLKAFEYLACGKVVVSTPLPSMTWLDSENVRTAASSVEFVSEVHDALAEASDPGVISACTSYAKKNTWAMRADEFRALLGRGQ